MKFILCLALVMFCSGFVFASEGQTNIKIQYGLGIGDVNSGDVFTGTEKSLNIGYYNKMTDNLGWDVHGGMLTEGNEIIGYGFIQFGSVLHPFPWMYVDHYFGPGFITKDTSKLTGRLQFSMHMGMGWRDPEKGTTIGFNWKHISNSGIKQPNKGVDFLLIQIGLPV